MRLLREAEDTRDTARRLHIVTLLRGRVCGRRSERAVCCATDPEDTPRPQEAGAGAGLRRLGAFRNIFHDIGGTAYALDSRTILIKVCLDIVGFVNKAVDKKIPKIIDPMKSIKSSIQALK